MRGRREGSGWTRDRDDWVARRNRSSLDLTRDEILAQILDRGRMDDWRALYALARTLWLAAPASLGESVAFDQRLPRYELAGT